MDKYEYKLKLDEMKALMQKQQYTQAAEIADSINWRKVRNVNALMKAGEVYTQVKRYQEAKEILLTAYDRSPIGRMIIYRLAELAITTKEFDEAQDYYEEFVEIAPHDNLKYVLRYKMNQAQGAGLDQLIHILEELKEQEYTEKWAFELAYLYHQAGRSDECIAACDELILWFGDGPYVEKALELKMLYQPLNKIQEDKYRQFKQQKDGIVEVRPEDLLDSGEIVSQAVQIPPVVSNAGRFNTVNLQEELARSMQQIMDATEKEEVADTMEGIKKIVEEIPYLQIPYDEEAQKERLADIPTDEEIDGSLKINFQEMLAEDYDGQIRLRVPERRVLESQITGQMSINDVLEEWEKTRRAAELALQEAEQQKLESAKAKALAEAGDIMERLADVIPQLDAGLTPKELLEQEYLGKLPEEEAGQLVANMNHILQQQIDSISQANAEIDELLSGDGISSMEAQELPETAMEQLPGEDSQDSLLGDIPDTNLEDALLAEALDGEELPEMMAGGEEAAEELSDEELLARELEQIADEALREDMEAEQAWQELGADTDHGQKDADAVPQQSIAQIMEEDLADDPTEEEERMMEEALQDFAQELVRGEKPRQETPEEEILPEIAMPDMEEPGGRQPITKLSREQKTIFSYFVPVGGMEQQICQALEGAVCRLEESDHAKCGVIVQGSRGSGKTVFSTSFVKALQKETGRLNHKVGKIDGAVLNQKDMQALLKKVAGGCLIIEKAGDISRETAVKLSLAMEAEDGGLLVILEDTKEGIAKALRRDEAFARRFTEKVALPVFTSDELVSFAQSYSHELGYEIDEMAVLALYNRISNIQRLDRATSLTEVKEIVDEAIANSERFSIKKVFFSKKYNSNDYIILYEKDFEE